MVKDLRWSEEREWRFLKKLDQCRKIDIRGKTIYVCDLPDGVIESIIFGYNFDIGLADKVVEILGRLGSTVELKRSRQLADGSIEVGKY